MQIYSMGDKKIYVFVAKNADVEYENTVRGGSKSNPGKIKKEIFTGAVVFETKGSESVVYEKDFSNKKEAKKYCFKKIKKLFPKISL